MAIARAWSMAPPTASDWIPGDVDRIVAHDDPDVENSAHGLERVDSDP